MKRCPDCGAELVASLPPEPTENKEPLVEVYQAPSELSSVMVKAMLEEAGIAAWERVERTWAYDGIDLSMKGIYSRLFVFQSQAEKAQELIDRYLSEMDEESGQSNTEPKEN